MSDLHYSWVDDEREPQCQPDPKFPNGRDIDVSCGAKHWCQRCLPYPAKRCGMYLVWCSTCGLRVGITTAGRPDDPRSIKVACVGQKKAGV